MNVLCLRGARGALVEPSSLCDFSSRPVSAPVMERWLEHKLLLVRGDKGRVCTGRHGRKGYLKGNSRCLCDWL